jgi:hypothetical protein
MKKIILVLIFVIAAFSGGFFVGKKSINIVNTSDTIRLYKDTTIVKTQLYPYKVVAHDTTIVFKTLDSCTNSYSELYKRYASQKFYKDTFAIDSSIFITDIVISKNNLDSLKHFAHINNKTIINNTIINESSKNNIYLVGMVSSDGVRIGADYNFNKYIVGVNYGVNNNSFGIKFACKIFSR